MTTGDRIKEARLKAGLTQSELAEKIGVKFSAIHKYETGIVVNLKRETIDALSKALNVRPSWLMCMEDVTEKEKPTGEDTGELSAVDYLNIGKNISSHGNAEKQIEEDIDRLNRRIKDYEREIEEMNRRLEFMTKQAEEKDRNITYLQDLNRNLNESLCSIMSKIADKI